jgi:CO/xanthine dehydrogenase Mo-binding subunit
MSQQNLNVVGQSVPLRGGNKHVTGQTVYYEDMHFNDMCYLKMVRSPVPHGKLNGIDFSEAEKVPGFVMALTHKDVPNNIYTILRLIGVGPDDEPVLAVDRVRWQGEAIAAVICETEEAAREAVNKVKLDIEELEAVFDPEEALKPGAPIIADTGVNYFIYENGRDHRQVRFGDVEKGFAEADFIVESTFQSRPIEHAPTETTGCIAVPEADGRYTVYTNTQALSRSTTSPSVSPVAVRSPNRAVNSYSLSPSSRKPATLVASPRQIGSMPVASGSRLPVWPAFSRRNMRRTRCTAALELRPRGLSSSSIPWGM